MGLVAVNFYAVNPTIQSQHRDKKDVCDSARTLLWALSVERWVAKWTVHDEGSEPVVFR